MSTELLICGSGAVEVLLALQVAHRLALAAAQGERLSVEAAAREIVGQHQVLAAEAARAYRDITTAPGPGASVQFNAYNNRGLGE